MKSAYGKPLFIDMWLAPQRRIGLTGLLDARYGKQVPRLLSMTSVMHIRARPFFADHWVADSDASDSARRAFIADIRVPKMQIVVHLSFDRFSVIFWLASQGEAMGLKERVSLYRELEGLRKRPLITYVTSARRGADGQIAADAIPEILTQLSRLPDNTSGVDLLLVSNGGDPTVAWRIVSLIRDRVEKFAVIVPEAAFSAATLLALGADEILMHPHGNLGPTDPQITNRSKNVQFGTEDLAAFLRFAKDEVGLTDQAPLLELFKQFSTEVGFVAIGVAARSGQLTKTMAEKLLRLHMKQDHQTPAAKAIAEALNTKFFHHGYPLGRSEAKQIGLPVCMPSRDMEKLIWSIWTDIEKELMIRLPFSPVRVLKENSACAPLFSPPDSGKAAPPVPAAKFSVTVAIMESSRHATRSVTEGEIIACRGADLRLNYTVLPHREGWMDVSIQDVARGTNSRKHK